MDGPEMGPEDQRERAGRQYRTERPPRHRIEGAGGSLSTKPTHLGSTLTDLENLAQRMSEIADSAAGLRDSLIGPRMEPEHDGRKEKMEPEPTAYAARLAALITSCHRYAGMIREELNEIRSALG